jgi:hypothetical protein
MKRIYETVVLDHYKQHNEFIFLSGARQVDKTTLGNQIRSEFTLSQYLN